MNVQRAAACLLLLMLSVAQAQAQSPAQTDPWFKRSARPNDFRPARLPWNTFSIELPEDWHLVPGYSAVLVTAAERGRGNFPAGAIVIEHTALVKPLGPNDVNDLLGGLEIDFARLRDPAGKNFEHQVKDVNNQRFILIQYLRAGFAGDDRVVVYAMPAGKVMYRLICIAPEKEIAQKYQAIFAHVAASFKPVVSNAD
jgi:hypothetical protein